MFDQETEKLLRAAPSLLDFDASELPQILTKQYVELMIKRANVDLDSFDLSLIVKIAETYEIASLIEKNPELRKSCAFVSATAYQLLYQIDINETSTLTQDQVNPIIIATVLFLLSEQYADARESAKKIAKNDYDNIVIQILCEVLSHLASGNLDNIISKKLNSSNLRIKTDLGFENQATLFLYLEILKGIEHFASHLLGNESADWDIIFSQVIKNSIKEHSLPFNQKLTTRYLGPKHLAYLLQEAFHDLQKAALISLMDSQNTQGYFWNNWIRKRAETAPFIWQSHKEAIENKFYETGKSAVLIFPTGSGKTTISSLKIANALSHMKKVIFIAPTHALVEQIKDDLEELFPQESIESFNISNKLDLIFGSNYSCASIEVMTPESCLAMLSFAPEAFAEVNLLVFDECHLLSSDYGGIRRSLDGMLCLLAFNKLLPNADLLFLSAMLNNGDEFASWIKDLTQRDCLFFSPLWKPSRQARGVLGYNQAEIDAIKKGALSIRKQKGTKGIPEEAKDILKATPLGIFGLSNTWKNDYSKNIACIKILNNSIHLAGKINRYGKLVITGNANEVAKDITIGMCNNHLKTIIFVNNPKWTCSVAKKINEVLAISIESNEKEQFLFNALEIELGNLDASYLKGANIAMPHSANLLYLERKISESLFKRTNGARIMVATPTLAQGLNLPAEVVILAGDKRHEESEERRALLHTHEILNAAARAGRAGHLANGLVILIPEDITYAANISDKLSVLIPENDRCVRLQDPIDQVLDDIQNARITETSEYLINKFQNIVLDSEEESISKSIDLSKSFAAFCSKKYAMEAEFDKKISIFKKYISENDLSTKDPWIIITASQAGFSVSILEELISALIESKDSLPSSIEDWVKYLFSWIKRSYKIFNSVFKDKKYIIKITGNKTPTTDDLSLLEKAIIAWIKGEPIISIEKIIIGDSAAVGECDKSRCLINKFIPFSVTFLFNIMAKTVQKLIVDEKIEYQYPSVLEALSLSVRKGFDLTSKTALSEMKSKELLCRVQVHNYFDSLPFKDRFVNEPVNMNYNDVITLLKMHEV